MRVLIIKTSSMGDVIHTLPALTDAGVAIKSIEFDWVVEQAFADIPSLHPLVKHVIPLRFRHWRKNIWQSWREQQWQNFWRKLREQEYDYVIDAQGLIKSAVIAFFAKGVHCGLDHRSAREFLASYFYQKKYFVAKGQHAISRIRQLFANSLSYVDPQSKVDYGIDRQRMVANPYRDTDKYVVLLHGTTWQTKHWPAAYWRELASLITANGYRVLLPWGNEAELQNAQAIAQHNNLATVLPNLSLATMAAVLADAQACVAVDTGLGHLAAALAVPTISLYGPTNAALTGTLGEQQLHLAADFGCAPCLQTQCTYPPREPVFPACFSTIPPAKVWQKLQPWLAKKQTGEF